MPGLRRSRWGTGAACLGVAGVSLLAPWAPTYDPWAWLVWGREVAGLDLDTSAGPAWKPLPVLVTTLLAPLGGAAPSLWLLLARAGGLLAVVLAFRVAARLAGGSGRWFAGCVAVLGLLATTGLLRGVAGGSSEGLLIALLLLAFKRHLDGHRGHAFALGTAAALLRPEVWPLLAAYAVWLWRREPEARKVVAALLPLVPLLWFLPELWGSGDLLRSSERAQIPNPGAPALADYPALEVLQRFVRMLVPPIVVGALGAAVLAVRRREAELLALVAGTAGWVALVALMSEAGFSGEERYLLVAAALASVLAGVAAGRLLSLAAERAPHAAPAGAAAAVACTAILAVPAARDLGDELAYAAELRADLAAAVDEAGGTSRLRDCGALYAGRARFPLIAWHVDAHISDLSLEPRSPGVVLRSRLTADEPAEPSVPEEFTLVARSGTWEVLTSCAT
jgi:hypothetical protein